MSEKLEKFAATSWNINDVHSLLLDDESWHPFQMTDEDARQFLLHNENGILDAMVNAGNEAIETLLQMHVKQHCHVWLVKAARQHTKDKHKEHLLYVMVTRQAGAHRWPNPVLTEKALEVLPAAANCAPGSRGWGDWGKPTISWCVEIDRDPKGVKDWLSYEWEADDMLKDLTPIEVGKQLDLLAAAKNSGKPVA